MSMSMSGLTTGSTILNVLLVGVGGGVGSALRYVVSLMYSRYILRGGAIDNAGFVLLKFQLPVHTLIVNTLGCFIVGVIFVLFGNKSQQWLILAIGFCGGLTTFSSFAFENIVLLQSGELFLFILYTGLSITLGLSAVFFAIKLFS